MVTKGLARPFVDRAIDAINSSQLTVQIQITGVTKMKSVSSRMKIRENDNETDAQLKYSYSETDFTTK